MFNGFKSKRGGSGDWRGGSRERRGGSSGGWKASSGGYKGKKSFGDGKEMHEATCSQCNKACEVPFKPNGRKPIFCSACFKREDGGEVSFDERRPARLSFDRGSSMGGNEVAEQLKAINKNLEAILRALTERE